MNPEMMEALQALATDRGIPIDTLFAALADALDAGAGERQRQRIHHHHPHCRLGCLAKREREEITGEPDHFFLAASTRMRLARTSIT